MELRDSRRLTGPNLVQDHAGAVIEVGLGDEPFERAVEAWRDRAHALLELVGWGGERLASRRYAGGASLAHTAPVDALYAACEVNECAFEAAHALLRGDRGPDLDRAADRLRRTIEAERNPRLLALRDAARARGLPFLADDELVTLGYGRGSRSFPLDDLPEVDAVGWRTIHEVPVALVTGTNGKSTTVRLGAAIAEQAGLVAGLSSTDWVRVGEDTLDAGDYSGPEGARRVLRDPRTEIAFLETARGGLLRRGVAVPLARAAVVLNVAADHLGEGGVDDLDTLTRIKLLVSRAVPDGPLVLNADDPGLCRFGRAGRLDRARALPPVTWFGLDPERAGLATGGTRFVLDGAELVETGPQGTSPIVAVAEVPATLGGAARFNVANALAAAAVARALGIAAPAVAAGLRAFASTPRTNPGRTNVFSLGGATAIADFAHNAHGVRALFEMAASMPARRRLILLGQAGDRTDDSVREMVSAVWDGRPDRIVIKRMREHLRGREDDEMIELIERELRGAGAPPAVLAHADSELEAVRAALAWARSGDLLLLPLHSRRDEALGLLAHLEASGWRPGSPLPGSERA